MYAHENNDELPPNRVAMVAVGDSRNLPGSWVVGNARRDTNASNIQEGVLYRFVDNPRVYRCPADLSKVDKSPLPRTRSYSLDAWLRFSMSGGGADV
jgi:hypothetical protein